MIITETILMGPCFLVFQAHTDFECFTILRQDDVPSALQVQNRKGQCEWNRIIIIFFQFILQQI